MRIEIPIVVIDPTTGHLVNGASVLIKNRGDLTTATVFSAEVGGGTTAQPLTTNTQGRAVGWIERGPYTVDITIPGNPLTTVHIDSSPATNGAIDTTWLADSAVATNKLATGAVTSTKLESDSITDGNRAVTTDHIRDGAVSTGKVADSAITTPKLGSGSVDGNILKKSTTVDSDRAVTTDHVRDSAVTTGKIQDGSVTNSKLSTLSIDGSRLVDTSVPSGKMINLDGSKLVDNSVPSSKLADNTVPGSKITTNSVALSKISSGGASQIIVCNGSGVPQYVTASGDVTTATNGVTSIGANRVTSGMLNLSQAYAGAWFGSQQDFTGYNGYWGQVTPAAGTYLCQSMIYLTIVSGAAVGFGLGITGSVFYDRGAVGGTGIWTHEEWISFNGSQQFAFHIVGFASSVTADSGGGGKSFYRLIRVGP